MVEYNYDACDSCQLSPCVYDVDGMTEAEQESQCPAVVDLMTTQPAINSIPWIAYRAEKFALIQSIINERGPTPLMELSTIADVPVNTLRGWQLRFFDCDETLLPAGVSSSSRRVIIKAVVENKGILPPGRGIDQRKDRAKRMVNVLAEFGPLPLGEMGIQANIPLATMREWAIRGIVIKTEHRRAGGDFRPNKIIRWVVGVI